MSNTIPSDILEQLRLFLCDHVSWPKILERVHSVQEQLKRTVDTIPVDNDPKKACLCCDVCGNTNDYNMIHDHGMGFLICLGEDGQGCGIVQENMLRADDLHNDLDMDDEYSYELFSPQHDTQSTWANGSTQYKRLNMQIERDLIKYNRDDTMTSDVYKDNQRKDVYSILDSVALYIPMNRDHVHRVKLLFHEYRSKMYRVHKVEVALVALFYIVLHTF